MKGNSLSSMTLGNGTTQSFALNDRLQMISQELKRGNEILQKYDYGYGQIDRNGNLDVTKNNGQLAKIESTIGANKQWTQKFRYDEIGRLDKSEEFRGDNNNLSYYQKFDYDRFGNLYRKNASNPMTGQATPVSFAPIENSDINKTNNRFTTDTTYDEAGNVVQDTKFKNQNFWYDANGRMYKTTRIDFPNQSNSVYDASGMRVANQVDGVWTFFVYDIGGKKIAEYGGLQTNDGGGVKYILSDHQGSSRATVNNAGYVNSRTDYTAFGEEIQSNIGQRTAQGYASSDTLSQKYALTEKDKATGLDHTWFRKHENQAGRWTSPDPYNGSMNIGSPQSFNRYSYVNNQPTNFVDPSGLFMEGPGAGCARGYLTRVWYGNDKDGYSLISQSFVCYDSGSGSSGGETGGGSNEESASDHCETFVRNARNIKNWLNENYSSLSPTEKLIEFSKILSVWYTGGWTGTNHFSALNYKNHNGGINGSQAHTNQTGIKAINGTELEPLGPGYAGTSGFKDTMRDSEAPNQDITHHIAAYLSAGINGITLAKTVGVFAENVNNLGDANSGRTAYNLGEYLSENPNMLNYIEASIRKEFCNY